MHILIGVLIVVGAFLGAFQFVSRDFDGFWNLYAVILLAGVPIGLTIMTYRFSTLRAGLRALAMLFRGEQERDRQMLLQRLVAFGREVRRNRGVAGSTLLEGSRDPVFAHLGRHVLQSNDPGEIEADGALVGDRELELYRAGERVFSTLGNTAPAVGMIGTVIGLIQLLVSMENFEQLGPGMAIALLTTFYGLILAHALYLPVARAIGNLGAKRAETINLVIDGMLKLSRRRPLHEVQEAIGGTDAATADLSTEAANGVR